MKALLASSLKLTLFSMPLAFHESVLMHAWTPALLDMFFMVRALYSTCAVKPQCLEHVEKPQMLLCMYAVIISLANRQLFAAKSGH